MQFSTKIIPNNRLAPASGESAPSDKSWIRQSTVNRLHHGARFDRVSGLFIGIRILTKDLDIQMDLCLLPKEIIQTILTVQGHNKRHFMCCTGFWEKKTHKKTWFNSEWRYRQYCTTILRLFLIKAALVNGPWKYNVHLKHNAKGFWVESVHLRKTF